MNAPATASSRPVRRWLVPGIVLLAAIGVDCSAYLVLRVGHSSALANSARGLVRAGQYAEARPVVERWVAEAATDADRAEAYYHLARVELAADRTQETVNALGKSLDLGYPPSVLAPYRAVIQARSRQYAEAEPVLRQALATSDEPMPEVAQALARTYLSTFRLKEAAAPIARWMKDAPDDPTPYLWRNEIDARSDAGHSVVIQNYKAALQRDPDLAEARLGLADRLRQANRLEEAAEEFAAYLKLRPDDPEGHVGAGQVALTLGLAAEATAHFDRALELAPHDPVAQKQRGEIDLKAREFASARDRFREVIRSDPFDPEVHYKLARALQGLGDDAGARAEDARYAELRADHLHMADLRTALVNNPNDTKLRLETAEWMLAHGHDDEGKSWCDRILKDHPGHVPTLDLLVKYYEGKNDAGKANYYRLLLKQDAATPPDRRS